MLPQNTEIDRLTTEILIYKQQVAMNIIEIGRRLIQVKEMLPHGEWGKWLEEKVEFSVRTAQNFMRAASEFSNTKSISDLTPTKVLKLLDLTPEEREQFIQKPQQLPSGESKTIAEMTTRELQQAIRAKKEAEQKAQEAQALIEAERQKLEQTETNLDEVIEENKRLNKELSQKDEPKIIVKEVIPDRVKMQVEQTENLVRQVDRLQTENRLLKLQEPKIVEKVPDHIQDQLNALSKRLSQVEAEKKNLQGQLDAVLTTPEKERVAFESKASTFTHRINNFLRDMGALAYIGQEVISGTPYTRQEYERALSQVEKWCRDMRMALSGIGDKSKIIDAEVVL